MWKAIENMPPYLRGLLMGLLVYRLLEGLMNENIAVVTGMAMVFLFFRFIAVKFVTWKKQQDSPDTA